MSRLSNGNAEIRAVRLSDAGDLASIYNFYIRNTTATFDTEEITEGMMASKIESSMGKFPFYVAVGDGNEVVAYCHAHPWKEKSAYSRTLETTIYVKSGYENSGTGTLLMNRLAEKCRMNGVRVLIACITSENTGSIRFHEKLGFKKVSHFSLVGEKFGRLLDVSDLQLNL